MIFFWRADIALEEEDKGMESLLIGLDTLKVATRNFSDENKLGEGGFGPVYKVNLKLASEKYLFYWVTRFTYIFPGNTSG